MNRIFFFLALFISVNSFSQSLRDSLFSGRLKADSALVAKSKVNEQKIKEDSVKRIQIDSLKRIGADTTQITGPAPVEKKELKYADNNRTWKKFTDEYVKIINAEMATSKKIKNGGYTVTIEYEIGTDGTVSSKSIICDPKSEALIALIQERMMPNAPQLAPQVINGVPRISSRRSVHVFVKEKN